MLTHVIFCKPLIWLAHKINVHSKVNCKVANSEVAINILLITVSMCTFSGFAQPNLNANLPCYAISKANGESDKLYEYQPMTGEFKFINYINVSNIYSIAIDQENFKLYAVNNGTLGIINPVTAQFEPVGNLGSASGQNGNLVINRIYGLAFDPIEKKIYGSHRMNDFEDDLLVKINPATGKIIKNEMMDSNGNASDYTTIQSSTRLNIFPPPPLSETTALLYEPISSELFCMQRSLDNVSLCIINKLDGRLMSVNIDLTLTNIFGLGSDMEGDLFASALPTPDLKSSLYGLNIYSGEFSYIFDVDEINASAGIYCFACLTNPIVVNNCDEKLNLNNFTTQNQLFKANKIINSNTSINRHTTYSAATLISLENCFEVPSGKNFTAKIEDACP